MELRQYTNLARAQRNAKNPEFKQLWADKITQMVEANRMPDMQSGEAWDNYCCQMYHANCEEREAWNDVVLTYKEYVDTNFEFLVNNYLK